MFRQTERNEDVNLERQSCEGIVEGSLSPLRKMKWRRREKRQRLRQMVTYTRNVDLML